MGKRAGRWLRLQAAAVPACLLAVQSAAALTIDYYWNQGATPGAFEVLSNWTGVATNVFEADKIYGLEAAGSAAALGSGQDLTIGGFYLSGGAELTIASGARLQCALSGIEGARLGQGTLNVDGVLDFGDNGWGLTGAGGEAVLNVNSGSTLSSLGTFFGIYADINATLNFNSENIAMRIDGLGRDGFDQVINVNSGAVWDVEQFVMLYEGDDETVAINLRGGTLDFTGLWDDPLKMDHLTARAGSNGIVVHDLSSKILLDWDDDQVANFQALIDDGKIATADGMKVVIASDGSLYEEASLSALELLKLRLFNTYLFESTDNAQQYITGQLPDGSWGDIDYDDPSRAEWDPDNHLIRMLRIATAFMNPSHALYGDTTAEAAVLNGLDFWYSEQPESLNWWWNDIGQQQQLYRILLLMEDFVGAERLATGLTYMNDPQSEEDQRILVNLAGETIHRGLLGNSESDVTLGLNAIKGELDLQTDLKIMSDYAFHEHDHIIYNGGYGLEFVNDVSFWIHQTRETEFAFGSGELRTMGNLVLDGTRWMIRGSVMDYSVLGRGIASPRADNVALNLREALGCLAANDPGLQGDYEDLKNYIESNGVPPVEGNSHFFRSDFMAHQRPDFYMSVKMCSSRTKGTEGINSQNMLGYWLGFGATYFLRDTKEYEDIFPVWDWRRIPGVTAPVYTQNPGSDLLTTNDFTGGVSNGRDGVASLEWSGILDSGAQKSWFLFDDEMIALGTAIHSARPEPVNTTLNQTLLRGDVYVNGALFSGAETNLAGTFSVYHNEIGYVINSAAAASMLLQPQVGSYSLIETYRDYEAVTNDVFTLYIDHGINPSNAAYAYSVLPDSSREEVQVYAADIPYQVAANDFSKIAVYHIEKRKAGAVFKNPTGDTVTFSGGMTISTDRPGLVLVDASGEDLVVAAAHPYSGEVIHVTIGQDGISRTFTFDLPEGQYAGQSRIIHPPEILILSPYDGSAGYLGKDLDVEVYAVDEDDDLQSVGFRLDGVPVSTNAAAPYTGIYRDLTEGVHTLTAVAVDDSGLTNSASIQITVKSVPNNYASWAGGWGVNIGSKTTDYDGDMLCNLAEYALGGNPVKAADRGGLPTVERAADTLIYIHGQYRHDTNLVYYLETTDDLLFGSWTNSGYTVIGTNSTGSGDFNFITNAVPMTNDQAYVRLVILIRPDANAYQNWAADWGVDIGSEIDDYDGDLLSNLAEYALGGNPADRGDRGGLPSCKNDADTLMFVHVQRIEDPNLVYYLETAHDLLRNNWTNSGYTVIGTNVTGAGDFNFVTNAIPMTNDQTFVRLVIEKL